MKFALLGSDPTVLPLVRAIVADPTHVLVEAALLGDAGPQVLQAAPGTRVQSRWDELLLDGRIDAVIVAGDSEDVLMAARQLATAGKALIIYPQATHGAEFVYQLTLIRDDTGVLLFPVFPWRVQPAVRQLRRWMFEDKLGRIHFLQMERECPAATTDSPTRLTQNVVDRALLTDLDLLRHLGGDYEHVTALQTGAASDGMLLETVTLAGHGLPEAAWSIRPGRDTAWKLTINAESGPAVLTGRGEWMVPQLTIRNECPALAGATDELGLGRSLLQQFESATAGDPVRPDWNDVTRAFEIVEATHRSVRRRRTIDLHFETPSERSMFKTQMTAIGCGVLVFTLCAMVVYLLVANLLPMNPLALNIARLLIFLPLGIFLALQFLILIARPSAEPRVADGEFDSGDDDPTDRV